MNSDDNQAPLLNVQSSCWQHFEEGGLPMARTVGIVAVPGG